MKKNIVFLITLMIIFLIITVMILSFFEVDNVKHNVSDGKIEVVATLFPQYDFAKQIGGDKVNVKLLLPPGTESHTYEPTPQDMIDVNNSNLFIYTGEEMEPWADRLISGVKHNLNVLDLSATVDLINTKEFEEKYNAEISDIHGENEELRKSEESYKHKETSEHEELKEHNEQQHIHSYDPHIWLNPLYAIQMVESIRNHLCEIDPKNVEYYNNNANQYIQQIQQLDAEFEQIVNNSDSKKIAFGGAFAYAYFVERYNLEFISAYQTCGESAEPSTSQVKEVIDYINQNKIPVVFYKEYTTGNIAKVISGETGAKMLVFNTVHNVSKQEIENNASYISIMRQNLENLKMAI